MQSLPPLRGKAQGPGPGMVVEAVGGCLYAKYANTVCDSTQYVTVCDMWYVVCIPNPSAKRQHGSMPILNWTCCHARHGKLFRAGLHSTCMWKHGCQGFKTTAHVSTCKALASSPASQNPGCGSGGLDFLSGFDDCGRGLGPCNLLIVTRDECATSWILKPVVWPVWPQPQWH